MLEIISGNLCSLLAMITDAIGSTRKTARGVLTMQTISQIFFIAGSIALKGYSAAVQNVMSVIRNLTAIRGLRLPWLEWALIAGGVVLGIAFNNLGVVGLLPVIANLEYSLGVFRFKDNERALKASFLINVILFTVFNGFIYNFVGVCANTVVAATTAISLWQSRPRRG
ncbi:MAG: YgjV family protein [Clostridia bacterium]|nr:YgjV family protein [Clostridia bacterium]